MNGMQYYWDAVVFARFSYILSKRSLLRSSLLPNVNEFLQLTKLSDSLSNFLEVLAADQKHFLSQRKNALSTVAFFVAIKQVRLCIRQQGQLNAAFTKRFRCQVRAMVLLTMGAMPSPYDSSTLVSNTLAECLSGRTHMKWVLLRMWNVISGSHVETHRLLKVQHVMRSPLC